MGKGDGRSLMSQEEIHGITLAKEEQRASTLGYEMVQLNGF